MKKLSIAVFVAVSALTACGPSETEAPASTENNVSAMSGGTFHFMSRESCVDLWSRECSATFPTDRCDEAMEGQPCFPAPFNCYKVINSAWVDTYSCY